MVCPKFEVAPMSCPCDHTTVCIYIYIHTCIHAYTVDTYRIRIDVCTLYIVHAHIFKYTGTHVHMFRQKKFRSLYFRVADLWMSLPWMSLQWLSLQWLSLQ